MNIFQAATSPWTFSRALGGRDLAQTGDGDLVAPLHGCTHAGHGASSWQQWMLSIPRHGTVMVSKSWVGPCCLVMFEITLICTF